MTKKEAIKLLRKIKQRELIKLKRDIAILEKYGLTKGTNNAS